MFKVTKYPQGTFSWVDCMSRDVSKNKQFYADLMGWGIDEQPMGDGLSYTMYTQDGETVAALSPMPEELQSINVPSHWQSYITVDSVDAMVDKVKEFGGNIQHGPIDVFDSGRMVAIKDPTGGNVILWEPKNHIGAGLVNTPGSFTWNELATRDVQGAMDFYEKLFGWSFKKMGNVEYYVIQNNGRINGGIIPMDEKWGDMPPVWMVYLSVADIDASLEKVKELGGKVDTDIIEADETGRFAIIFDPAGAPVTLIQTDKPDTWVE